MGIRGYVVSRVTISLRNVTHDDLLAQTFVHLPNESFKHKDTHQQCSQCNSTDHNNRDRGGHLDVPFGLITRVDRIDLVCSSALLGGREVGYVFRSKQTYSDRFAASGSPLDGEFTLSYSPVCHEYSRVQREDQGIEWRIRVFGRDEECQGGDDRQRDEGSSIGRQEVKVEMDRWWLLIDQHGSCLGGYMSG